MRVAMEHLEHKRQALHSDREVPACLLNERGQNFLSSNLDY